MTLIFADKTRIAITGNPTMFLFRNAPQYLDEWLDHKERFDYEMRKLDAFLKRGKEVKND
jgi:hypothetical protein